MSRYQVKGINDEQGTCMCCGKTGLKRVVWIEDTETGDINHFGTSCAKSPAKAFGVESEIDKQVRKYVSDQAKAKAAKRNEAIRNACNVAHETYPGELVTKMFSSGPMKGQEYTVPVDGDAYQAYKMECINEAVKSLETSELTALVG